ncbi:MAG TPA: HlyD family efflux transporter periplasmic adaptor subunit [Paludibacter sp.]|nr:HlyD family efflux transporter periplasmic adaptor subunit [Paludibacter sp.]
MLELFPPEIIENTVECYHARISTRSKAIYGLILLMILLVIVSLPLVQVDITSQSRGVIRSPYENTTIQSALYGEVVSYRMLENKTVQKGDTLIILNSDKLNEQISLANRKIHENDLFVSDIACLLTAKYNQLLTPKYRGEYYRYQVKLNEQRISVSYLRKELATQKTLADQKVISNFDYLQSKNNYDKANEQLKALEQDYQTNWVAEQTTLNQQNNELVSNIKQIEKEKQQYIILAPMSGSLVQVAGFQKGNFISPGQNLAYISTNNVLLAECYISPSDIGYIRQNQPVTFQFDAFNYHDWGMMQGKVSQMLNDVVLIDQEPMFRVRCALDKNSLQLKNGYRGNIQKGLTFTARFKLNRRSLWQLLFDKVDNWLNPKIILH